MLQLRPRHLRNAHVFPHAVARGGRILTPCWLGHKDRPVPTGGATTTILRWQSSLAGRPKKALLPELLNVYRAGTYATVAVGIGRAFAWLTFIGVETLGLPAVFFAADVSNWMLPLVLVGGPVPMIVTSLATGPMIHDVTIKLPDSARRSKDALKSFVKRLPPDTVVRASYMRWMPWPRSSDMKLRDLRRIQPSWKRGIANLEHLPGSMKGQKKNPFYWFAYTNWGKYYINREQSKDMSASPGVWNTIWHQIPEADSKSELEEIQKAEASPVGMANRPARHEAKAFAVPLPSTKR